MPKVGYRSRTDLRGSPEVSGTGLTGRNGIICPALSQPSFACAPARSAQPVYVARGTVTSGSLTPAMSLPSPSVFGTKLG